nr:PREDICTED: homeotic protein caudal [Bemisia tabaci]
MMDHFTASMYRHHQNPSYPPAGGWYSNPYHQQQQFLSCMHESSEQTAPWGHHHHMFQSPQDWGVTTVSDLVNVNVGPQAASHEEHILPSPPITVSGSEISSPGTVNGSSSPQLPRPPPPRSPYEWMKKSSFQNSTPNPGKTRTKDKYRVVYTDQQRLELEKEFHYSRYITIRRKAELASTLGLSERQVKIWFQNRRAKERKQSKKREELIFKH